jgi:dipeptidyl aminopeptidase/acylaminoacyl peptidase
MIRPLLALCFMLMLNPAFTASLTAEEEAATPSRRNLEIDDLFRFKSVGNPEVSPDGKWVAYTVRSTDLKEEKSETRIWLAPVGDGEKLPMTVEGSSASQPRFSPDGRYLSFLASRKGGGDEDDPKTQVWLLDRRGGEARQLTKVMQGVSSYEWSPDATRLVLLIKDPSPEELERQKHKEQGTRPRRTKTRPPYVVDRLQAKRDYAGYLDRRRTHLYVFDVAAKTSTQITSGDADDRSPVWSPDGRFLAFVSNRTEDQDANYDTNIWVVASDNPDMGKTLIQVTQNPGGDEQPAWSPDGKWIAYVSNPHPELLWYATNQLALIPAPSTGEAAEPRLLIEALDRNARGPAFAPDSSAVYFLLEDSGERHLARVAVKDGALTRPIDGPRTVGSFAVGKTGLVAALISEPKLPSEVFLLEPGKRAAARGPRQLTTVNQKLLDELRPGDMEEVQFTSADGTPVEGFLVKPPAFSPELEYPGILLIHGGPVSQFSKSWSFQAQLFAANGYVVMMVNPRGSSGYGQEFSKAIFADWGNKDVQDVLAGVDYAVAQGYVDPDRLGVGGWSYGGMMTNYVISQTTRFKAAISGAGGALWTAHWGHDHYQREYIVELGLPWKNREAWERISSPFYNVEKITTPVLYMGGALDWNVPIIGSEHMYQSLRVLGRTTKLVVYPGEHHGIRKPSYQKDRYERNLAWYGQYVKGEPEKK